MNIQCLLVPNIDNCPTSISVQPLNLASHSFGQGPQRMAATMPHGNLERTRSAQSATLKYEVYFGARLDQNKSLIILVSRDCPNLARLNRILEMDELWVPTFGMYLHIFRRTSGGIFSNLISNIASSSSGVAAAIMVRQYKPRIGFLSLFRGSQGKILERSK